VFFGFCWFAFWVFHFFCIFRAFFQVLKNKNKLWFGEHNTTVVN
jgi:hypothetical protein